MFFFFADDSRQASPSRDRMSSLIGIGGFSVLAESLNDLEAALEELARIANIPAGEEFKWSPGRHLWMRDNLVGLDRQTFFMGVIETLARYGAVVTVVISDTDCETATRANNHELDVTTMFLERAHIQLHYERDTGVVVVDRPGGGRSDEDTFLFDCAEFLEIGSEYVRPKHFALNVLCGSSRHVRCIQAADLITGASLACIAGETTHSPPIFDRIKPLLRRHVNGTAGGVGLKLHPDGRFLNLYHWLLGETHYVRGNSNNPIPQPGLPYYDDDGL